MSGQPHDDRGDVEPTSELDSQQPLEAPDAHGTRPGLPLPQWDAEQAPTPATSDEPVADSTEPSFDELLGGSDPSQPSFDETVFMTPVGPEDNDATINIPAVADAQQALDDASSPTETIDAVGDATVDTADAGAGAAGTESSNDEGDIQAVAAPAPSGIEKEPEAPLPMRPRNHGRRSAKPAKKNHTLLWAVLAGIVVVLIAVALILFFTLRDKDDEPTGGSTVDSLPTKIQKGSPAEAVENLGEAFKAGNAQDALGLLNIANLQDGKSPLLDNKIYAAAKNRPTALTPEPQSYGVPASDSLTAGVSATMTQAGKDSKVSLRLTREDPEAPWKVATASLPALDVTDGGGATVQVNGTNAKLPGGTGDYSTHRLFALPGDYVLKRNNTKFVSYPGPKAFRSSALSLAADPDHATTELGTLSLQGKHNKAFEDEATKTVNAWIDKCIASTSLAPKGCPIGADGGGQQVKNVKWKLDQRPKLSFPDSNMDNPQVQGKDGKASVEAKVTEDGQDATLEASTDYEFTGTLTIKGNKVSFSYDG